MRTFQRFPRLKEGDDRATLAWFIKFREKYPPPRFVYGRDGTWNPGDFIPAWLMSRSLEQLQDLCRKHALKPSKRKWKCIKRMYLHWRAAKLKLACKEQGYFGYGVGFERTRTPTCTCGSRKIPKRFPRLLQRIDNVFIQDVQKKVEEEEDEPDS